MVYIHNIKRVRTLAPTYVTCLISIRDLLFITGVDFTRGRIEGENVKINIEIGVINCSLALTIPL